MTWVNDIRRPIMGGIQIISPYLTTVDCFGEMEVDGPGPGVGGVTGWHHQWSFVNDRSLLWDTSFVVSGFFYINVKHTYDLLHVTLTEGNWGWTISDSSHKDSHSGCKLQSAELFRDWRFWNTNHIPNFVVDTVYGRANRWPHGRSWWSQTAGYVAKKINRCIGGLWWKEGRGIAERCVHNSH